MIAHVRTGGTRAKEDFDDLTRQILDAWNQIVNADGSREKELKRVFVMGAITTGMENGFFLPKVGTILLSATGIVLTGNRLERMATGWKRICLNSRSWRGREILILLNLSRRCAVGRIYRRCCALYHE